MNVLAISQGIALERNREEWMLRVRRMGLMPMQAAGASNHPISLQPFGQWSLRAVCGVAALVDSALSTAHRAWHPIPQRPLRDPWEIVNTF
ncbi:MAG: hypothetical protein LWW96_08155 [Acidovorax sp.]|uniref:hypothetical protein n=1 Tax=Acidovorax sp. TaxID=1872122 RepID=UPI0025BA5370|nr:hypothetical protein [Acidovorax sp.]MCE1192109.1 hypothetical protein [Acidovorax sp.]